MRTNGNNSPLPASFSSMADGRADSTYGMTLRDYASFAEAAGFEPIFEDAVGPEVFHAYGRADLGLLLTFDSYHGQRNSALVQFRTDRVAVRSDHALASLASCDALGPNGSQTHVALDARHGLLALMAEFERTGRLQPYWGNAEADGAIPMPDPWPGRGRGAPFRCSRVRNTLLSRRGRPQEARFVPARVGRKA